MGGGEEVPSVCQNTLITSAGDNSIIWRRAQLEPFVRLTVPPNDVIWRQPPCKVGPPPNRLFTMHGTIITDGLISGRFYMKGMKSKKLIKEKKNAYNEERKPSCRANLFFFFFCNVFGTGTFFAFPFAGKVWSKWWNMWVIKGISVLSEICVDWKCWQKKIKMRSWVKCLICVYLSIQ